MWKQPYSFREGTVVTLGLMLTGAMLQLSMGPLDWDIFMWPANIIALVVFVAILTVLYFLRRKSYFLRFMTTPQAAVPAIVGAVGLTIIMGITRQAGERNGPADPLGFTRMLESWPFILVYIWMTAIVGEETIRQIATFKARQLPSLLSHLGLLIALTCGTLGSADMQRMKMYCEQGKPEWRCLDAWNNVHPLPIAVELQKFSIDEYPPKLMVIDASGKPVPAGKPEVIEIDDEFKGGKIMGWTVSIVRRIDNAMPTASGSYQSTESQGSECALLVRATSDNLPSHDTHEGWVTCGSRQFNYHGLRLDDSHTLVMAPREPRRYSSLVNVYTQDGKSMQTVIEVNKPLTVNGWKIYQYSYDERMGRWSNLSILEFVRDPWLPSVYTGILLLALGAVGMLFRRRGKIT